MIGPWTLEVGDQKEKFSALTIIDLVTNLVEIVRVNSKTTAAITAHFVNTFLLERANIAHQNRNLIMEAAIKQLAHIEATIHTYASIKRIMHQLTYHPGLTSIQIPMEDKSYKTIMDPK
jgi:hypothetical protein